MDIAVDVDYHINVNVQMNYWPAEGRQICSMWMAFDTVELDNGGLEFVRGSHLDLGCALIQRGQGDQVVVSHDICTKTRLVSFGGHGYRHMFLNVVPLMRRKGFSENEIDAIVVRTPQRLLTFI